MWRVQQARLDMRRGELVARSAMLRERMAKEAQPLRQSLAVADRVREGALWLKAHPQWLAALVAVPLLLRPRRAFAWGLKLWWGWRMIGRLRGLLSLQAIRQP